MKETSARSSPTKYKDLWQAIGSGDIETVAKLIDAEPKLVEARSKWGNSPLKLAAEARQVGALRLLLERGADPNAELHLVSPVSGNTDFQFTAIMAAGSLECIETLAAAGANVNARDSAGRSVFKHQAMRLDADRMELLKKLGANVDDAELRGLLDYAKDELSFRETSRAGRDSERIVELRGAVTWLESQQNDTT